MNFLATFRNAYKSGIQLSSFQAQTIAIAIRSRAPGCRLLVFGVGHDTALWLAMNFDGDTHFLEASTNWLARAKLEHPGIEITQMPTFGLTVANSAALTEEELAAYPMPQHLEDAEWDVIVVDGPSGYSSTDPGRALAISWAARLARRWTHVFVDDYERPLEARFTDLLLRRRRGTASCVIPASDHAQYRQLFWSAGDPADAMQSPLLVVLVIATPDYARRWRFCLDSQFRYCRKNGYEHRVLDGADSALHPKWAKLQAALSVLQENKNVLLIDADAEVDSDCPAAHQVFSDFPEYDIFVAHGISRRPNSGVLLLRGGRASVALEFLRECLGNRLTPVPKEVFVSEEGENGHVISLLKLPRYERKAMKLDPAWNCSDPERAGPTFIRHYTNKRRAALERMAAVVVDDGS